MQSMAIPHTTGPGSEQRRLMGVVTVPLFLALAGIQVYLAVAADATARADGLVVAAVAGVVVLVYPTSLRTDRAGGVEIRGLARRRRFEARDVVSARWGLLYSS